MLAQNCANGYMAQRGQNCAQKENNNMAVPPTKRYAPGDRVYVRAQQVWLILVARVMSTSGPWKGRLLTYGDLAEAMGVDPRGAIGLGRELGIVGNYCIQNGLPALNCIVVGQDTGAPGPGVVTRANRNWRDDARDALNWNWFQYRVPTTGTFRQVWED
jgi:hypothetical protein